MRAEQVKVPVTEIHKVRSADGGEQERIQLRLDDAVKPGVNCHLSNVYPTVVASAFRAPFLGTTPEIFRV